MGVTVEDMAVMEAMVDTITAKERQDMVDMGEAMVEVMEAVTEVTEDTVAMGEDIGARTNIENNKEQE